MRLQFLSLTQIFEGKVLGVFWIIKQFHLKDIFCVKLYVQGTAPDIFLINLQYFMVKIVRFRKNLTNMFPNLAKKYILSQQ